jgi:hypothetical protein
MPGYWIAFYALLNSRGSGEKFQLCGSSTNMFAKGCAVFRRVRCADLSYRMAEHGPHSGPYELPAFVNDLCG